MPDAKLTWVVKHRDHAVPLHPPRYLYLYSLYVYFFPVCILLPYLKYQTRELKTLESKGPPPAPHVSSNVYIQ